MIGGLTILSASGDYVFFDENFEEIDPAGMNVEPIPLLGNGLLVGANVFDETDTFLYNYFDFDAPNIAGDGARFCNIAGEQGGPDQGNQVLSVFNDYNNADAHTAGGETFEGSGVYTGGDLVDANVYLQYFVEPEDLGTTVTFAFDAKLGDFQTGPVLGSSPPLDAEAEAFLKVLDPANGYQPYPNIQTLDATGFAVEWETYTLTFVIDSEWEGKVLQAGFRTKTSNYAPSAMFYDNISLTSDRVAVVEAPPRILATSKEGGEFLVTVESKPGFDYTLWKGASVSGPYTELGDPVEGDGGDLTLSDMDADETSDFYRVSEDAIPE